MKSRSERPNTETGGHVGWDDRMTLHPLKNNRESQSIRDRKRGGHTDEEPGKYITLKESLIRKSTHNLGGKSLSFEHCREEEMGKHSKRAGGTPHHKNCSIVPLRNRLDGRNGEPWGSTKRNARDIAQYLHFLRRTFLCGSLGIALPNRIL